MSAETFEEQIEEITGALGDATRRGIYVMIRESHDPITAAQIALISRHIAPDVRTSRPACLKGGVSGTHRDRLAAAGSGQERLGFELLAPNRPMRYAGIP